MILDIFKCIKNTTQGVRKSFSELHPIWKVVIFTVVGSLAGLGMYKLGFFSTSLYKEHMRYCKGLGNTKWTCEAQIENIKRILIPAEALPFMWALGSVGAVGSSGIYAGPSMGSLRDMIFRRKSTEIDSLESESTSTANESTSTANESTSTADDSTRPHKKAKKGTPCNTDKRSVEFLEFLGNDETKKDTRCEVWEYLKSKGVLAISLTLVKSTSPESSDSSTTKPRDSFLFHPKKEGILDIIQGNEKVATIENSYSSLKEFQENWSKCMTAIDNANLKKKNSNNK
jgi:hypothetical protein